MSKLLLHLMKLLYLTCYDPCYLVIGGDQTRHEGGVSTKRLLKQASKLSSQPLDHCTLPSDEKVNAGSFKSMSNFASQRAISDITHAYHKRSLAAIHTMCNLGVMCHYSQRQQFIFYRVSSSRSLVQQPGAYTKTQGDELCRPARHSDTQAALGEVQRGASGGSRMGSQRRHCSGIESSARRTTLRAYSQPTRGC